MVGKLYLTGTPIGNLGDLSPRASEVLGSVDFIAAEDTRVTLKLLNHFGIQKPLVSYYAYNQAGSGERILTRLLGGESCALVTDAGMPAISDPGEDLVRLCAEAGVPVVAVPGPSAVVTALALSALPTGRFTFEGFLSTSNKNRFRHLESLRPETRTMVFYEAPHKLIATLRDMLSAWGDRKISLCREMTKLHEEVIRTTLSEALRHCEETPPKGEYVLVIEGAAEDKTPPIPLGDAVRQVALLREGGLSLKEAVRRVAEETGFPKKLLYDAAVEDTQEPAEQ